MGSMKMSRNVEIKLEHAYFRYASANVFYQLRLTEFRVLNTSLLSLSQFIINVYDTKTLAMYTKKNLLMLEI